MVPWCHEGRAEGTGPRCQTVDSARWQGRTERPGSPAGCRHSHRTRYCITITRDAHLEQRRGIRTCSPRPYVACTLCGGCVRLAPNPATSTTHTTFIISRRGGAGRGKCVSTTLECAVLHWRVARSHAVCCTGLPEKLPVVELVNSFLGLLRDTSGTPVLPWQQASATEPITRRLATSYNNDCGQSAESLTTRTPERTVRGEEKAKLHLGV
jgi:hypothetical protein